MDKEREMIVMYMRTMANAAIKRGSHAGVVGAAALQAMADSIERGDHVDADLDAMSRITVEHRTTN